MKVIAIFLCAILLLGGVGSVALYYTPQAVAINAVVGATNDFEKRDEIRPLSNMLKEGSLEFSASKFETENEKLDENTHASGKIYFSEDATMLQSIDINWLDQFKISGDAYFSNDLIYVKEDHLLGGAYGVKPPKFTTDLMNSIFATDSGSDYAMADENLYDAIIRSGDTLDLNNMEKDAKKLIRKYETKLWLIVCEHAEFDSNNKKIDLNGTKKSVRVITVEINPESWANIIQDAYDYLADDQDMLDFIKEYESLLTILFGEMYDASEYGSLADAFEEAIQDLAPDVEEYCDGIIDNEKFEKIEFEVATPKFTSKLLKFVIKVEGVTVFTLDLGEQGMKNTDQITLKSWGGEYVYTMKKYDNRSVATLKVDGEKIFAITVSPNRETFKLETADTTINGTIRSEGDRTTITLDKITYTAPTANGNGVTVKEYKTDIQFVIREKDEIPAAPTSYNRISDITEEDIEAWIKKFEKLASKK